MARNGYDNYFNGSNTILQQSYTTAVNVAPVIVSILLLIAITARVYLFRYFADLKDDSSSENADAKRPTSKRLQELNTMMLLYPVSMIVTWLPNSLSWIIYVDLSSDDSLYALQLDAAANITMGIGSLYGALNAACT